MKTTLFSILFCASTFVLIPDNIYAQDTEQVKQDTEQSELTPNQQFKNSIGIAAGTTTAYGLSYRRYIHRFAVQLTFAPYKNNKSNDFNTDIQTTLHTGLTFFFVLLDGAKANFFIYESNYFYYNEKVKTDPAYNPYNNQVNYTTIKEVNQYLNIGVGLGFEVYIERRVGLNFMAGYGAYEDFDRIGITGEMGLYFKL